MTPKKIEFLCFKDWRETLLERVGMEAWVTAYQMGGESGLFNFGIYGVFIPSEYCHKVLDHSGWDFSTNSCSPGNSTSSDGKGNPTVTYRRFQGIEGAEPLVLARWFHGVRPDYLEILEEFRLYFNLFEEKSMGTFFKITDSGREEPVVRIIDGRVEVRLKEVRQFAATKRMHFSFQFDLRRFVKGNVRSIDEREREQEVWDIPSLLRYDLHINNLIGTDGLVCSSIHGKKLIPPFPIEHSGISPYDDEEEEEIDFIIGTDEFGKPVSFSSGEDKLANFFGKNPGAPVYVTPVFFSKTVLTRYLADPDRYTIEEGYLRCGGLWGVRIDNDHSDCVAVMLGDLGRDMPLEERKYWRAFNMPPEGRGFSNSNFKRSFLVEDAVPQEPEHRFQAAYARIAEADPSVISWPLLLPLGKSDEHHIKTLHVPITDTQAEFDQQVLSLTRTMIDSLNVVQLKKFIVKQPDMMPIALCEEVCKTLSVEHYEKHTGFLRNLQSLRSLGAAHRKGSDYAKAVKRFDAVGKPLPMVFRGILEQAIEFLDWVLTTFNVKLAGRS